MRPDPGTFVAALERAVTPALRHAVFAPAAATLIGDAADAEALQLALPVVLESLARRGVPRGRACLVLAAGAAGPARPDHARSLGSAAAIPVIAHDPRRGPWFTLGRDARGEPIVLNDALREAEVILLMSSVARERDGVLRGGSALVHPGLAPGWCAGGLDPREVAERLGVDLCVLWSAPAPDALEVWAGAGLEAEDRARAALGADASPEP